MGKRGPKPTPTKVLEMRGSWRASARSDEPQPEPGKPQCPSWMSAEQKRVYRRLARGLQDMGVLAKIDRDVLTRYTVTFVQWMDAEKVLNDKGPTQNVYGKAVDEDGTPLVIGTTDRPEVARSLALGNMLNKLEAKLGLSPADRVGLKAVGKTGKSKQGKSRFFAGGAGAAGTGA